MTRHFSYLTFLFPVRSPIGIWKYVDTEVDHNFIEFWKFLSNPVKKNNKNRTYVFFIPDFQIDGAYSGKGMISRSPLNVLKVSADCFLFYLEPVWLYLPTVKSIGQNFFKKLPFFVNSKLWTLLDFDRNDVRPKYSNTK